MIVERIDDLPDWEGSDGTLAIIIRAGSLPYGTTFLTSPEQSQQVGIIHHPAGHAIVPHIHCQVARTITMTQEVIFVRSGMVKVSIFNTVRQRVAQCILSAGDTAILLAGGHGFEFLEDSELVECKTGPYLGSNDKVQFHA